MGGANPGFESAMRLYREGRLEEAAPAFDAVLASDPAHAMARSVRGLIRCHRGDFDAGLADLRAAVDAAPRDAAVHTHLGMILYVMDRLGDAEASLRRALALTGNFPPALANLALVLRDRGDFAGAERAARSALAQRPQLFEARVNLGLALLAQGKYEEGWAATSARPAATVNLRDPRLRVAAPHHDALPSAPAAIIVHGEQGLGDTLFFLRFAPRLRALGHRLAFWGDARLHGVLARAGMFEHFLRPEAAPGEGVTLLWAGDLPHLLDAHDPARFPPALALPPDDGRVARWRERLAAWGPAPYVGLTWRAGLARSRQTVLSKNIDPGALGAALAGMKATFVSLQRNAVPGEIEAFAGASGAKVADAGVANDDLEDALAVMALLDEYVGVSNTNMHLRAGLGRTARVLVPFPPEWRWLERGERSPWFPDWPLYREERTGWAPALTRLAAELAT